MPKRVPIIWTALAGLAFAAYLGLMAWCGLRDPSDAGMATRVERRTVVVASVEAGSVAERAGLQAGDRVLAPGGIPLRTRFDWMVISANWDTHRPIEFEIERRKERRRVTLDLASEPRTEWRFGMIAAAAVLWGARLFALCAAIIVLWRGQLSLRVLVGAWFLASAAVASVVLLPGMARTWRELPAIAGLALWVPALSPPLLPALFFAFYAGFPKSVLNRTWHWMAALAPAAFLLAYLAQWLLPAVYAPDRALAVVPSWLPSVFAWIGSGYVVTGIGIQTVQAIRPRDSSARTHSALLAGGAVVGWAASIPIILFDWFGAVPSVMPGFFDSRSALLSVALFVASLVVLAVILVRRKVFGFRLIVRAGLRYALARNFLLSIVPICAILLLADLFRHRERPLTEILSARAWAYAIVGGLGALSASRRKQWLEALDRRFFREQYQAQQILKETVRTVGMPGNLAQIASHVVAQVEAAMHAEVVALMVREAGEPDYHCVASAPAGQAPPKLPGESRLVSLVRLLGKPVEMSLSSSWLLEQLPAAEVEYARSARIEIMLPVTAEDGPAGALLVCGPKRSEQPYSREDQDLLSAIAASLALRLSGATPGSSPATAVFCRECPVCGLCYDSDLTCCSREGTPLVPRPIPRVLFDRYRLERRVGSGGMGTVYEGLDTALDRRVAVKVIHDRLVGSTEAAARFRREARTAASFSHPNIVTVYDFGILSGTRGFLVMELLVGLSLRDEMQRCERFPMTGARAILAGICEGVDAAHRRQLIHRDLKPENIFLDRRNEEQTVKILDFGLIKSVSSDPVAETVTRTQSGMLLGTFRYIAPEQFLGDAPGVESDLWALGVICYEMLTNTVPFEAGTTDEWRKAALSGRFTPVRMFWPEAPAALNDFFASALSPDRTARPASARELLALFDRAMQTLPAAAVGQGS